MRKLCLVALLLLAGGCAHWEFDVLAPEQHRGHIARKQPTVVQREPLEYVLQSADGRLVAKIYNRDSQLVTLLGGQSYVVAGDGQTIPLPMRAIAPMGFVKLILPPYPTVYRAAPTFGVGVGFSSLDACDWGYPYYPYYAYYPYRGWGGYPFHSYPYYPPVYLVEAGDQATWRWRGQDTIRLHLVYQHGQGTFEHDFAIQRVKVK